MYIELPNGKRRMPSAGEECHLSKAGEIYSSLDLATTDAAHASNADINQVRITFIDIEYT